MSEETKLDKDYLEAFNLGYELAKELNLKSPMFKNLISGSNRMIAMQAGMLERRNEIIHEEGHEINLSKNQHKDRNTISKKENGIDHDNGFDLSI